MKKNFFLALLLWTYYDWIVFWIYWNTILLSTMTVCQLGPQWWYFLSRRSCHDRWCVVCGVWWVVSETINIVVLWVLGHRATPCVGPRSVLYSLVPSSAGERERTVWAEPQLVGEPREDRMRTNRHGDTERQVKLDTIRYISIKLWYFYYLY